MEEQQIKRPKLVDLSWQVTEEEYRADEAYSYSTIAKFHREGIDNISKLYDKVESKSLLFGSMVDTLLTDGEETFKELYMVMENSQLTDSLVEIAVDLFNNNNEECQTIDEIPEDVIHAACVKYNYYANDRYKAHRLKTVREQCNDFYSLQFLIKGKKVVSQEEVQTAYDCVMKLKTSMATSFYFADNDTENDGIERFYQLKFKSEYNGIPIRCMSDLIVVDHNKKEITPVDLKTSYKKEWRFYDSFISWCYYIQAQLYWRIIKDTIMKDPFYCDYTLMDYKFIVISAGSQIPLVWEYSDTKAEVTKYYGKRNQIECKNWRYILTELDSYLKSGRIIPFGIKLGANSITEHLENL